MSGLTYIGYSGLIFANQVSHGLTERMIPILRRIYKKKGTVIIRSSATLSITKTDVVRFNGNISLDTTEKKLSVEK